MILLFVCSDDPTTTFLSRRVNVAFNATVEGSIALQRALFLRINLQPPELEDQTNIRINPMFDCTGVVDARRYIEVYNFGPKYCDWYRVEQYTGTVDIWCEDAVLGLCDGPLFEMILLERRAGDHYRIDVELYFRLKREGPDLPEAVRVPVKFDENWEQITIGEVVEKARAKLGRWYPEHYGIECVA